MEKLAMTQEEYFQTEEYMNYVEQRYIDWVTDLREAAEESKPNLNQ